MENTNIKKKNVSTFYEWLDSGGIIWMERDILFPHEVELYTTNSEEEINFLYQNRNKKYINYSLEEYFMLVAKETLECFADDLELNDRDIKILSVW